MEGLEKYDTVYITRWPLVRTGTVAQWLGAHLMTRKYWVHPPGCWPSHLFYTNGVLADHLALRKLEICKMSHKKLCPCYLVSMQVRYRCNLLWTRTVVESIFNPSKTWCENTLYRRQHLTGRREEKSCHAELICNIFKGRFS